MTKVGSLVQSRGSGPTRDVLGSSMPPVTRGRWGIVIKDGEGFRCNQVRVRWGEDEQGWCYIADLVWVTGPVKFGGVSPPSYKR